MSVTDSIAKLLVDAQFTSVFTQSLSALDCAEPIIVSAGAFKREERFADEERGHIAVTVLVVRELAAEAERVAEECERCVRRASWEPYADAGRYRICGLDTSAPAFRERDSSGRYVWGFEVDVTVVRAL